MFLQLLMVNAAFWTGVGVLQARTRDRRASAEFAASLFTGAVLARLGGGSLLFVPAGVLLASRRPGSPLGRAAFEGLAWALVVARAGCLFAGCCHGTATSFAWAVPGPQGLPVHPTPLYEMVGMLLVSRAVRRADDARAASVFCLGLGTVRLLVEPWRAGPIDAGLPIPPAAIAAGWIAVGSWIAPHGRSLGSRSLMRGPR